MAFRPQASMNPGVEVRPGRAMRALGELLRRQDLDPFALFDVALEMLVRQFMVDHALISRISQGKLDTFWWVDAGSGAQAPMQLHQSLMLCEQVLLEPEGCLSLGTVFPSEGGPGIQAFAGVVLQEGGRSVGTLSVIHSKPYAFHAEDLDFIRSVAGLLGRALEIENLKYELQLAKDSLALSTAVVQDSALESSATGLPNARFLEVWTQIRVPHARRQNETLCLALWEDPKSAARRGPLHCLAQTLRGDDQLIELGPGRFLLVLPNTLQEGAQTLLERVREELGGVALGATLWLPEKDDLMLRGALGRAEQARQEALRTGAICWKSGTHVSLE